MTETGPNPDSAMDLLLATLASLCGGPTDATLRSRLMASGWTPTIRAARQCRLDAAFARVALDQHLFAGLPRLKSVTGESTPPLWAEDTWQNHIERRKTLRNVLVEIVQLLNAAGHVPVLLKGARSLWADSPPWRSMRDLDLLVAGKQAAGHAQKVLLAAGFEGRQETGYPDEFHHLDNLYREDLPGWVEIHSQAASFRAESLLPTAELVAQSRPISIGGATAKVIPPVHDLLHGLAHHHLGHWEAFNGALDPKGLFELAATFAALDGQERQSLAERAGRSPVLLSMLELWLAAANDRLGLPVMAPLHLMEDAGRRWKALAAPANAASRLAAIGAELAPAMRRSRLVRCTGGATALGRMRMRLGVLGWAAGAWGSYYRYERWM